jgi:hypothetical protein
MEEAERAVSRGLGRLRLLLTFPQHFVRRFPQKDEHEEH